VQQTYFPNTNHYILLSKLQLLHTYQTPPYPNQLLNFPKQNKKPIKPIPTNNSKQFFLKHRFKDLQTKNPHPHHILISNP
ncbi:GNAT family protein, partial [Staphylococcus epidermidis]